MKITSEQKTQISIFGIFLILGLILFLLLKIAQQIVDLREIEYERRFELCQKDTLFTCYPINLDERNINCKCKDGTTKTLNLIGEPR